MVGVPRSSFNFNLKKYPKTTKPTRLIVGIIIGGLILLSAYAERVQEQEPFVFSGIQTCYFNLSVCECGQI